MQTIYYIMDKSKWGYGAWTNEPDKVEYLDRDTRLPCLIMRTEAGHLCGYVGVPEGHPCFGRGPDKSLAVHGGNNCNGVVSIDRNVWWFGFDCGHSCDYSPGMMAKHKEQGLIIENPNDWGQYRTMDYVILENAKLALQLHQLKAKNG